MFTCKCSRNQMCCLFVVGILRVRQAKQPKVQLALCSHCTCTILDEGFPRHRLENVHSEMTPVHKSMGREFKAYQDLNRLILQHTALLCIGMKTHTCSYVGTNFYLLTTCAFQGMKSSLNCGLAQSIDMRQPLCPSSIPLSCYAQCMHSMMTMTINMCSH